MVIQDMFESLMKASEAALMDVRAQTEALAEERVLPVDVHVPMIVLAIALSAPRIEEVVAESSSQLPQCFDRDNVTRLRTYAAAAWQAHVRATRVSAKQMRALQEEAYACREALLEWARGLADIGWVAKEPLGRIGVREGSHALAHDLLALAQLLSTVGPRLAVLGMQDWHLARASALGLDLFVALSASSHVDDASRRMRARAYSLLVWAYDECRHLIRFMRWQEGDVEDIAPSIGVPAGSDEEDDESVAPARDRGRLAANEGPAKRCLPN